VADEDGQPQAADQPAAERAARDRAARPALEGGPGAGTPDDPRPGPAVGAEAPQPAGRAEPGSERNAGPAAARKPPAAEAAPRARPAGPPAKPAPPQAPPLPPELEALRARIGTLVEGAEPDESNDLMLGYVVPREGLLAASVRLRDEFGCDYLSCLSGVDYPEFIEVVYHLFSVADPAVRVVLKTRAPKEPEGDCRVPSVTPVWPGANWHEREAHDLLGVAFDGHPDLRRILLPEDFAGGHPLRKDYRDQRPPKERKIRVR
jgi:NADH-quinone oxidoreductase subunit C